MKNNKKSIHPVLIAIIDILCAAAALLVFALFHHVLPSVIYKTGYTVIQAQSEIEDWGYKFPDKFTADGLVVKTSNSYMDSNVNITIQKVSENGITYFVSDIYIRNISFLKTAFAKGSYGKSITDTTLNMATENQAIIAFSGDYYGIRDKGVVVRNGIVYRTSPSHAVCVLNYDGTMDTYPRGKFNIEKAKRNGAYQAWDFGPVLLEDGEPIDEFDTGIAGKNPRCAIGYYEPGHYVFVVVDGRQEGYSQGMTLVELSQLFYNLGCKTAYNLDGGQSAVMCYDGRVENRPAKGGREISDIIYITSDSYQNGGF